MDQGLENYSEKLWYLALCKDSVLVMQYWLCFLGIKRDSMLRMCCIILFSIFAVVWMCNYLEITHGALTSFIYSETVWSYMLLVCSKCVESWMPWRLCKVDISVILNQCWLHKHNGYFIIVFPPLTFLSLFHRSYPS